MSTIKVKIPNHWRRANRAVDDFNDERDQLFVFKTREEFIAGMQSYGLSRQQSIQEWLRLDAGEPGITRRFWLKHGFLP